jgi:nucleoside-diphosphate-sugar epimerase
LFYEVNVVGTVNVLEFCRRRSIPLTFVSSYVYGVPKWLPIDERHPVEAFNPYSHTKILAEETVRYYATQFGIQASIVRPFNVYGPGQNDRFLIPTLIGQALDPLCDCITVRDPRPRRDYVHVDDVVSLIMATMAAPAGDVYNAGSGVSVSIETLVATINARLPSPKALASMDKVRASEVLDVVADIGKARRELGWEPRVTLEEGLNGAIDWARARGAHAR